MTRISNLHTHVATYLETNIIATTHELAMKFGCSSKTIFRILKQEGYITSYNKNNTVVALHRLAKFDENGLWEFKGARFSTWGTIKTTIQKLVELSSEGLTTKDLRQFLQDNIYHQITASVQDGLVSRDTTERFPVYYAQDPKKRHAQQQERMKHRAKPIPKKIKPPSKELVIRILVIALKYHISSVEDILPHLAAENIQVSETSIRWVFQQYNIEKKGSPSNSSRP